jgi:hypothetical protein
MMNDLPAQSYIIGLFCSGVESGLITVPSGGRLEDWGEGSDEWFLCMAGNGPGLFDHPGLWWGLENWTTKGHSVDALAPGGDEGRGTLRKAMGSREQALIHGCPNGATPS